MFRIFEILILSVLFVENLILLLSNVFSEFLQKILLGIVQLALEHITLYNN